MKKVSIIIPSYGKHSDPCRAIDSVLNQDYDNIEVILVDDNGEGSEQQLQNARKMSQYSQDSRVKYIVHGLNKGGSAARNTGVYASDGAYLCFLDDDDELADKSKVRKQMEIASKLNEEWAGTYSSLNLYRGDRFLCTISASSSGDVLQEFIEGDMSIGTAAPIISRESFDSVNGFDESFERHQDWEFFCRLMDKYKLKAVPDTSYNRYYKTDVKRKSAEKRLEYMDKYVSAMTKELKSLPPKKLARLMRRKYVSVLFAFLKEKKLNKAISICKKNGYTISDYLYLSRELGKHAIKKISRKI